MPPTIEVLSDEEEDFGLSSGDDADCIALVKSFTSTTSHKRKGSDIEPPAAKRLALDPNISALAVDVLAKSFRMKAFRLMQEQAIATLLSGGSATVVFPTGGGKSLCFQIPALLFSELDKIEGKRDAADGGITLVVSPLIALMKDQVDALVKRGIKAAVLDSTKTREAYLHTCDMLRNGQLKLLYCAPERLNNEGFVEQMKHVRGGVRLLAVDEAHCISEWGHAFRPDYLKVSRFAKEIRAERVICLTATATPRVATDICKAFNINENDGLFRTSTYRPNLRLLAEAGLTKQDLYPKLFQFLRANPGPTIVYVTLQKQTEALAADLRKFGFKAKSFHAGMDTSLKTQVQEEFMKVDNLVIVATIAFGMGIDKPNIRNVVHFNIPSSLESYSQEIGRAGRDGNVSNCMFYICSEDLHLREMFARGDLPSKQSMQALLLDVFDAETVKLPIGEEFRRNHYQQGKEFDIRPTTLANIYAQLELTHGLIRATTPVYTKYSYAAGKGYIRRLTVEESPAAGAIKRFGKKASTLYHLDIDAAVNSLAVPRFKIVQLLNSMDESGDIVLKPSGVMNAYKINSKLPKSPFAVSTIADQIYATMEKREEDALARAEEMLSLVTDTRCFSRSLAEHFGDNLPDGKAECGHCEWCLTHTAIKPVYPDPVEWNKAAFAAVLKAMPDRDDPRLLARIAFGITSPRITAAKLGKDPVFGSMANHTFSGLLKAFTKYCDKVNG